MEPLGPSKPLRAACRPSTRQRKRLQSCSDTESCASARPSRRKRPRRGPSAPRAAAPCGEAAGPCTPTAAASAGGCGLAARGRCSYDLSLFVRWHSAGGGVKVNRLRLDPFDRVEQLRGLSRRLVKGAFAGALPDYLTSEEWYKFSPAEELISLPGDIARTEFRLAVTLDGWEYTVCERTLPGTPDPDRRLLVTLAEFESDSVTVSDHQYIVRLLSYPTVCVKRAFLDAAVAALRQGRAPDAAPSEADASGAAPSGEGTASEATLTGGEGAVGAQRGAAVPAGGDVLEGRAGMEEEVEEQHACTSPPSPSMSAA